MFLKVRYHVVWWRTFYPWALHIGQNCTELGPVIERVIQLFLLSSLQYCHSDRHELKLLPKEISLNLLPPKSREIYQLSYNRYLNNIHTLVFNTAWLRLHYLINNETFIRRRAFSEEINKARLYPKSQRHKLKIFCTMLIIKSNK